MNKKDTRYKVWFFGGGETRDDKFNVFTGSFIGHKLAGETYLQKALAVIAEENNKGRI